MTASIWSILTDRHYPLLPCLSQAQLAAANAAKDAAALYMPFHFPLAWSVQMPIGARVSGDALSL